MPCGKWGPFCVGIHVLMFQLQQRSCSWVVGIRNYLLKLCTAEIIVSIVINSAPFAGPKETT